MGNYMKNYTNGVTVTNGESKNKTQSSKNTAQAWRTLNQYLPSRNADTDFWWKYSGHRLAVLLEEAEYPIDKQTEALVFFYHWAVSH